MRDFKIKPVLNGFIVEIGCQTVVFTNMSTLVSELLRYQANPHMVEREYQRNAVNKPDPGLLEEAIERGPRIMPGDELEVATEEVRS
jgi:hypothetical protein